MARIIEKAAGNEATSRKGLDAELQARIEQKLTEQGLRPASTVTLSLEDASVCIQGRVRSYYERQLLVHLIRSVPGVRGIDDLLEVVIPRSDRRALCSRPNADPLMQDQLLQFAKDVPIGLAHSVL